MRSVALVFRAWLRQRWRSVIGLALLTGLIGGVALTAVAGARRTDTAYPRLLRWSNAANVQVIPNCVGLGGFYQALGRLPQVASIWTGVVYYLGLPVPGGNPARLEAIASPDGAYGLTTDRMWILAGQRPAADDPAAVMVDQQLAARQRLRPGSTLHLLGVPSTARTCRPAPGSTGAPARAVPMAFRVPRWSPSTTRWRPLPG